MEDCESSFTPPTELGDVNGKVSYTYQGQPVGDVEVKITDAYYNEIHGIVEEEPEKETCPVQKDKTKGISPVLIIIACVVAVLAAGFLVLIGKVNYERKKAEERRREARRRMREEWDR